LGFTLFSENVKPSQVTRAP